MHSYFYNGIFHGLMCILLAGCQSATIQDTSDSYLLVPGVNVGDVSIGAYREKVLNVLGKSISSFGDGDQYADYIVHYTKDKVSEVVVTSDKFQTAEGISIKSNENQFLNAYENVKKICYKDSGASSTTTGTVYDAIDLGIALDNSVFEGQGREFISTITIHAAGVPATIYGEVTLCK